MEISFEATVVLNVKHRGENHFDHVSTEFNLEVNNPILSSFYLEDGLPNAAGSKILTNVLVQGLIGNIHMAHGEGFMDSAEHLRFIISELERGFASLTEVKKSTFGNGKIG